MPCPTVSGDRGCEGLALPWLPEDAKASPLGAQFDECPCGCSVAVGGEGDAAPVDVERPSAVGEDVGRDRAREGLAGDDDGLERGLERGPQPSHSRAASVAATVASYSLAILGASPNPTTLPL